MSFVTDREKEVELMKATSGAKIKIIASLRPPTSLSQPKSVPALLSDINKVGESYIFSKNFMLLKAGS